MGKIVYKVKESKPELDDYQIKEIKLDNANIAWGVDTISLADLKAKIKNIDDEIVKLTDRKLIYIRQGKKIQKMLDANLTQSEEDVDDSEIPTKPEIETEETQPKKGGK